MKTIHHSKPQRGFFDLGISAVVLVLAGALFYGAESSQAEPLAAEEQAVPAEQQAGSAGSSASDENAIAENS